MGTVTYDGKEAWRDGRRLTIGSSDGPSILGCGYANSSISSVWADKVNGIKQEFDAATLELMDLGAACEPYVIAHFARLHPELKVTPGSGVDIRTSTKYPFLSCSLDATFSDENGEYPLEAKWIVNQWSEWKDGGIPLKYQVQLMHQMIVMDAPKGCVAAFVCGKWNERWMDYDEEIASWMIEKYTEFWSKVISGTPPEDDGDSFAIRRPKEISKSTAKMVGGAKSKEIREYLELDSQIKELQAKANRIKNRIAPEADCEYFVLDDQSAVKVGVNTMAAVKQLPRKVRIV